MLFHIHAKATESDKQTPLYLAKGLAIDEELKDGPPSCIFHVLHTAAAFSSQWKDLEDLISELLLWIHSETRTPSKTRDAWTESK